MAGIHTLTHILEINRLIGPNFPNWFRTLKIVLQMEKIDNVLYYTPPTEIPEGLSEEERVSWKNLRDHEFRAQNYILAWMSNDLQHQHENFSSITSMIKNLKDLYGKHSIAARYEISKKVVSGLNG